jgi:hypothetical protein
VSLSIVNEDDELAAKEEKAERDRNDFALATGVDRSWGWYWRVSRGCSGILDDLQPFSRAVIAAMESMNF